MSTSTAAPLNKTKRDWGKVFSTVGIVLIVIYCLAPFYWMLVSSLRNDKEIFENSWWPRHPSLENYKAVFSEKNDFANGLINSLVVSIIVTIVALAVATFTAYALARLDFRGKGVLMLLIFIIFIGAWNEFLVAVTMIVNPSMQPATVLLSKFTGESQFDTPFGSQMAAGVIMTLPLVIMVLLFQRRIVAGLAAGGLKQ